MDSTTTATATTTEPNNLKPQSATKLPIKRKNPNTTPSIPRKLKNPNTTPPIATPPFKFHRIWTEPDEIRFLQGLLNNSTTCSDLSSFYDKFSTTTTTSSQNRYTKSQLSQKLRRLRKKFRVVSSRISRGYNPDLLSSHDRALFDLSSKLWSPNIITSNYDNNKTIINSNNSFSVEYAERINLVGVKVNFSPVLPGFDDVDADVDADVDVVVEEEKSELSEVVVARSVVKVFDECIKEAIEKERLRCCVDNNNNDKNNDFQRRWKEQKAAELDVFARRLKLLLHNSC